MKGFIQSDVKGGCPCGGTFKKKIELGYQVPVCDNCGKYPAKLRIGRYLPTLDGTGQKVFIRYDHRNKRLENIQQAIRTLEFIDYELEEGKFDPKKYASRSVAQQLTFKHFVENKYLTSIKHRLERGEIAPSTITTASQMADRLNEFFGKMDLRDISTAKIQLYFESYTKKLSTRNLSISFLKIILKYAMRLEYIDRIPSFPKIKASPLRDVESFPSPELQKDIIEQIENPTYRAMIKILSIYALRPSDIRPLKRKDLDFVNKTFTIQRHFSGSKVIPGRKSRKIDQKGGIHHLPMTDEFIEAISMVPIPIDGEAYVFPGVISPTVSTEALRDAWRRACEKLKINYVSLYPGTKHARLSYLKSQGYSDYELMVLAGLNSIEAYRRYAQLNKTQHVKLVENILKK